ncbi:MAG: hypothetical protein ACFFDQ_07100 [Candidatus Thorarchaeota archaeon]
MGERTDPPRLYIVVDPSKLVRCEWCGSLESKGWIYNERGTFCSNICVSASKSKSVIPVVIYCAVMIALLLFYSSVGEQSLTWFFLIFTLIGTLCLLYERWDSSISADYVPRNSRRTESLYNTSLLKTMLTHVECPNCDGNIDIAKIGEDQIYHCGYCGASGIVEITFTGKK